MEYLPFGETLVEEHLNSYNSPYKFNAKELDEETGWYYYGARYYNPKWSIWLSVDPLAVQAPSWTPYRYGFNNPVNHIDPNGLYEWRVNSETGKYKRIGDKGGDEYQHIYFNDNKEATEVLAGKIIYVGAAADNRYKDGEISFAVSTKDLWSDLPDEYQGAYTRGDLVERYRAQMEGGDKYDRIRSQEAQGLARRDQIWNRKDLRNDVIEKMGNDSGLALAAYTGMLQTIIDFAGAPPSLPSRTGRNTSFSPHFTPRASNLSNNSWIRYLQLNKGKYKGLGIGNSWIRQAAKDYRALKKSGKL